MIPLSRVVSVSLSRYAVCASLAWSNAALAQSLSPDCDMGEQTTMSLKWTDDMRPIGEAIINGTPVPAMISTAAADSAILNKKILDRLGVPVRTSQSVMFPENIRNPTGIYSVLDVSFAVLDDFSFGAARRKNVMYQVEDFMDDTFGVRIGAANLLYTDLEIALDGGYIKFFKPKGCFAEHLAYWDPQAVAVTTYRDEWARDPRVLFTAIIGGKNVSALLSTATPHSYMPKAAAERLGLTPGSAGAEREEPLPGHGADQPVWKVPVPSMSIGALEVKDFDLRLMDLPHSGEILVLGADFLHRHHVYIARAQNKIYFSAIQTPRAVKRGSVEVIGTPAR